MTKGHLTSQTRFSTLKVANDKLKIAIDIRPLSRPYSGIRRYLENVIYHLAEQKDVEWLLYSDLPPLIELKKQSNITIRVSGKTKWSQLYWHILIHKWIHQNKPNVYWSPRHHLPAFLPKTLRKVVTIHDMVWLHHPETMKKTGLWSDRLLTPQSIKVANSIIAVSNSTANEIRCFYPKVTNKICVIRHGGSDLPAPIQPRVFKDKSDHYILSVGTIEPRKNYTRLLSAYEQYRLSGHTSKLVIVGNKGWGWGPLSELLTISKYKKDIIIIEDCDDENLAWLYENAEIFVCTSLSEGYGLPVDEAKYYNIPMVLSDIPVFHEHCPDNPTWVDPYNINDIARAIIISTQLKINKPTKMSGIKPRSWKQVSDDIIQQLRGPA